MGAIELLLGVAFTVAVGTGVALTLSAETFLEFWERERVMRSPPLLCCHCTPYG